MIEDDPPETNNQRPDGCPRNGHAAARVGVISDVLATSVGGSPEGAPVGPGCVSAAVPVVPSSPVPLVSASMNGAQLHLLVNHIPEFAGAFGAFLMLGALLWKKPDVARAALVLFVVGGVGAALANVTGEEAEHVVTQYPGVYRTTIHAHEEAAEIAWIAQALVGVAALGALALYRRRTTLPAGVMAGFTLAGVAMAAWMGWVSHLGGFVRHPEIRDRAAVVADSTADAERRARRLREQLEREAAGTPAAPAAPAPTAPAR